MNVRLKKTISLIAIVVTFLMCFAFSSQATIDWGNAVYISQYGQVVNSITYNGVTVNAIYAPRNQVSNYDSDGTFCCAAFVKKFYSSVFGVGVNNLIPGNTPNVYSGGGYFYKTTSPQVGDIAASSGHWAIVKEVSGSTITLVEQNAWNTSYTSAMVNRKLILPESSYWFWRWSGNTGSDNNVTPTYFTALWHSNVSDNNARIDATINLTYIQNCGFYIGTSTDNMQRIDEATNANVKNIWFDIKDYYGSLYSGTTYYYKIYIVVNGVEYCSQTQSFTTTGPLSEMTYPTIIFDKEAYIVGDTVSFSWEKTNSNTDFYQYWVIVQNTTTGKSYYGGATGDAGDVSKNTCSFVADEEGEYKITVYSVPHNNKEERQKADVKYITVSKEHIHKYSSSTVKTATCSSKGSIEYKCACGYSYFETVEQKPHTYKTTTTKATLTANGKTVTECTVCGDMQSTATIYSPKIITLSKTAYTYNGKEQKPSVTVKDSKGKVLKNGTDYTVKYENGRIQPGRYNVKITFIGKYSGVKRVTYTIAPESPIKVTAVQSTSAIKLT